MEEEEVTQVASQKPSQSSNQVAPHFRYPNIFDKKIETLKANHLLKAFLKESISLVLSTCLAKISTAMPKEMFGALVLVHKRSTYVCSMYVHTLPNCPLQYLTYFKITFLVLLCIT
jgi:hypothetical protein